VAFAAEDFASCLGDDKLKGMGGQTYKLVHVSKRPLFSRHECQAVIDECEEHARRAQGWNTKRHFGGLVMDRRLMLSFLLRGCTFGSFQINQNLRAPASSLKLSAVVLGSVPHDGPAAAAAAADARLVQRAAPAQDLPRPGRGLRGLPPRPQGAVSCENMIDSITTLHTMRFGLRNARPCLPDPKMRCPVPRM
jgi:hypothetical protein